MYSLKNRSLRFKLVAPLIVSMACLTIFLVTYTYRSVYNAVSNAAMIISSAQTDNAVNSIYLLIKSLRARGQDLVVDPGILDVLASHCPGADCLENPGKKENVKKISRRLRAMTEGYRYFRDILLLDNNGSCIATSNESYLGQNYLQKKYVQQALRGHFFLGKFTVGRVTKTFSSYFSAPIDVGGKIGGVLVIISDFPKLIDYGRKNSFGSSTMFISLLGSDGVFMAHKNTRIMGNKKRNYSPLYKRLAVVDEKGASVEYSLEGEDYIGYAQIEPNTQWIVISSGLKKDIFFPAYRTGVIVFLISFFFLCVVSWVIIRSSSGILNSLFSLIAFAKDVSKGNLNKHLKPTKRKDELGTLHEALENLVNTLQSMLEERQAANKMKDEFLANMSHEMRTPLNAVLGMTYLASKKDTTEKERDLCLERIKVAAQSLLGVIDDILDISKVEAGKMTIEANVFPLRKMVEDTLAIHQQAAEAKGVDLAFHCPDDVHDCYLGDVLRIRQILNNLLGNALKFTKSGSVILRCWQEAIEGNSKKAKVHFSVSDTGVGIAPDVAENLFQPFIQADASVTRQFGGTGLGLAISKHLVELMDGAIWLKSVEGQGSVFTFYLTLSLAEADPKEKGKQAEEAAFEPHLVKGKRILLAEDNSINRIIFEELLAPLEVALVSVDNGKKAVEKVRQESYDLILMDMQMPVMGGLEATEQIRSLENGKEVIIIALTANARGEDKARAFDVGMDDYLVKPIDPELFTTTLGSWLSGQRKRDNDS